MTTRALAPHTQPEERRAPPRTRAGHALVIALLALASFGAYAQVREHAFLTYDDPDYVVQNPNLRHATLWESVVTAFREPYLGNWAPLTSLSLRLDFALHGLDPAGFLLGNVALHALAGCLLYAALARMTGAPGRSAFVAGVFALHPLHVESVAWVSSRKDVLSGVFCMLTLLAWAAHAERPRAGRPWLATLCLVLGLLSKATLVTLPAVLLLLDVWPLGRLGPFAPNARFARISLRQAVSEKIPMFAAAAAVAIVTWSAQRSAGAATAMMQVPLGARVRNALESVVQYLGQSFWPHDLAVFYPHALGASPPWQGIAAGALLVGVCLLVAREARTQPACAVGWLWFLGMLVPTLGLVQVGLQARADRYTYLPLIGLAIAVAWGAGDRIARSRARRFARPAAAAALAALGICTWLQVRHWQDSFTLFQHALDVTSGNFVAHLQLGSAHLAAGDADAAERQFERAAQIAPDWAPAQVGLGDARALRGDLAGAIAAYEQTLRAHPRHPLAAGRYGLALLRTGRAEEAREPLEIAVASHPGSAAQHAALAIAYAKLGRVRDAIASNRTALALDPQQLRAANNLAWLLATSADASREEREESVRLAERTLRVDEIDDASQLDTLAAAYASAGRFADAEAAAARAVAAASARGDAPLANDFETRRALYAAGRAYVEHARNGSAKGTRANAAAAAPVSP